MRVRGGTAAATLAVGALLLGAGLAAAPRAADAPAAAAPPAASTELARKGELIFNIGGCTNCHTAKGGALLAGGDPIRTPYGDFHAPNITPDPETGIGRWSEADFVRAMREGRAPGGAPLYPSFPYTSYTKLTDEDARALKAYLDTVAPVRQPSRPHDLGFPYSIRWGLLAWQLAFFEPERFEPDPTKDAAWNRGAYLVNGPGHCQECHTPRNFAGALDEDRAFAGAPAPARPEGAPAKGGAVPNISGDPEKGLGRWSERDIVTALTLGMLPDGDFVGGEMTKVVNNATSKLPPEDVRAIAVYLKSLPPRR